MSKASGRGTHYGSLSAPKNPFPWLLAALFVLVSGVGLLNLYSATGGAPGFFTQLNHFFIALPVFIVVGWIIPVRWLNAYAMWIFGLTCLALVIVLVLGHTAGGSQRWLMLGPLRGQPSEFAKISCAILVARFFFASRNERPYQLRDLWPLLAMVGLVFGLIFQQPDLGTAGICLLVVAAQLAFVRLDLRSVGLAFGGAAAAMAVGWNFLRDYQKQRVMTLLNPDLDPHGAGYNTLQSLITVGSGRLFGKGFMRGTQTQHEFIPARHTDFAASVFAEEHGFWLTSALFLAYAVLTLVALEISRRAKDPFSALLAIGIGALIFIQFAINVAMILGMFPVVGTPLPLFSKGGSSLQCIAIALGILVAISRRNASRSGPPPGFVTTPL